MSKQPGRATPGSNWSGARESNAGDEFHIIWTARRAIRLLDPNSALEAITVEGLAAADTTSDDLVLGVDLAEYSRDLGGGSRVSASQLKYSVRHPDRPWTIARLAERSGGGSTSVARRLADIVRNFSADATARLEAVRLVTNQPVGTDLAELLADHRSGRPATNPNAAGRLMRATGLGGGDFDRFLGLLDVRDPSAEQRAVQRLRLEQEAASHVLGLAGGISGLLALIRSLASPEGRNERLTRDDVLAALHLAHEDDLFPAPPRFAPAANLVASEATFRLGDLITNGGAERVLLTGAAGAGKTTTLLACRDLLPPGSVVIAYDGWGKGEILNQFAERDSLRNVLTQLANEAGVAAGSGVLVGPDLDEPSLKRAFQRAVRAAAESLATPGSLLVLGVDAADNAAAASLRRGLKRAAIRDIWGASLPGNVRLVLTARTAHRDAVLPEDPALRGQVAELEVTGLSATESAKRIHAFFPDVSAEDAERFHAASRGNPRIQSYALASSDSLEEVLASAARVPRDLFSDLFESTLDVAPGTRERLAVLSALAHPVEFAVLCEVWSLDADHARKIVEGLRPGITFSGDRVSLADEDFDAFLRDQFDAQERMQAHAHLADLLWPQRTTSQYASRAIAGHLANAGQTERLCEIAGELPPAGLVTDPVARLQIARDRSRRALASVASSGATQRGLGLLALRAETINTHQALTELIAGATDLAFRFADPSAVAQLMVQQDSRPWLGPIHLEVSAYLGREVQTRALAQQHFDRAEAWLRRWAARGPSEGSPWRATADDIAAGCEAVYWLRGAAECAAWLQRWRPEAARAGALRSLVERLAPVIDTPSLERLIGEIPAPASKRLLVVAALWRHGRRASPAFAALARRTLTRPSHATRQVDPALLLAAAEAITATTGWDTAHRLGELPLPAVPRYAPSEGLPLGEWTAAIRGRALVAALSGETIADLALLPAGAGRPGVYDGSRERFKEQVIPLQRLYMARARLLVDASCGDDLSGLLRDELARRLSASAHRWYRRSPWHGDWLQAAGSLAAASLDDLTAPLEEIADAVPSLAGRSAPWMWLRLAEALATAQAYRPLAIRLLDRAVTAARDARLPAPDRRDLLIKISIAAGPIDRVFARDSYVAAVEASGGADDQTARLLALGARLAPWSAELSADSARELAERLISAAESAADFVGDRDAIPHVDVAAAVARLVPTASLELASRWDDERRVALSAILPRVATTLCAARELPPGVAFALLTVCDEDLLDPSPIIELLDRTQPGPERDELLRRTTDWTLVRAHPRLRSSLASAVVEWAKRNGPSGNTMEELGGALRRRRSPGASLASSGPPAECRGARRWPEMSAVDEWIDQARSSWDTADEGATNAFWIAAVEAVSAPDRVPFLDLLVQIARREGASYLRDGMTAAFDAALRRWLHLDSVRLWSKAGVRQFVDAQLANVLSHEWERRPRLRALAALPLPEGGRSLADDIFELVVDRAEAVDSSALLDVVEVLADLSGDGSGVAESVLARLVARLAPGPRTIAGAPSAAEAVADFVWALGGHPDRVVRALSVHSGVSIVEQFGASWVDLLVHRMESHEAAGHLAADHEFYWLSARVSALQILDRVSRATPGVLCPHLDALVALATDAAWPHAQARGLARRTSVRVLDAFPQLAGATTREQLVSANSPVGFMKQRRHVPRRRPQAADGSRFRFDGMDTIPYWYEPLANVFGVDTSEVVKLADAWVVDEMGASEATWWNDPRELIEGAYHDTRNDHGSMPRIEIMRTYLEFHAMQIVAGRLVDSHRVVRSSWAPNPWQDWLGRWLDTDPDWAISEIRSRPPWVAPFDGDLVTALDGNRPSGEYFEAVLLGDAPQQDMIVVAAYASVSTAIEHQSVTVQSALVSPRTSWSLVSALNSASDAMDFRLPTQPDDDDGSSINDPPFVLEGWLQERHWGEPALDKHDPYRRGLVGSLYVPNERFRAAVAATPDRSRTALTSASGEPVQCVRLWSDETSDGSESSSGSQTWVARKALSRYLVARKLDLILTVTIHPYRPHGRSPEERHEPAQSQSFVLQRDGELRRLGGGVVPR